MVRLAPPPEQVGRRWNQSRRPSLARQRRRQTTSAPSHGTFDTYIVGKGWEQRPFRTQDLTLRGKPLEGREHGQKRGSGKGCSVVVPASPAHRERLEAKPAAKRKPSLCPTRCNCPSTVAYLGKGKPLESVTPQHARGSWASKTLPVVSDPS